MTKHLSVDDETSFLDLKIILFWDGGLIVRVGSRNRVTLGRKFTICCFALCLTAKNK